MTSKLTREMIGEARDLLRMMGIPTVQAPSEAEAQAAHMAASGAVWAAGSKDYDSLLFGAPRLVRFITLSGKEFLPSKGTFRPIEPELIEANHWLKTLNITRAQLIDLGILVGTDFNEGIKGIGPKKALKLVQEHGAIEHMPDPIRTALGEVDEIRQIYLQPSVTDAFDVQFGEPDFGAVVNFLCAEREFSKDR